MEAFVEAFVGVISMKASVEVTKASVEVREVTSLDAFVEALVKVKLS